MGLKSFRFFLWLFMGLIGLGLGLLTPRPLHAEGGGAPGGGGAPQGQPQGGFGYGYNRGGGPAPSNGPGGTGAIQIWDDRVFNLDSAPQGPAVSPGGRYSADAPDYNTEQQAGWKRACGSYRDQDARAYRECYQREKARTQDEVRQSLQRTERGGGPMRGIGPRSPLDEAPAARVPSQDPAQDPVQEPEISKEND